MTAERKWIGTSLLILYPFLVYGALIRLEVRWVALALAVLAIARWRGGATGLSRSLWDARWGALPLAALALAAAAFDSEMLLLATPALISAGLLWVFARSLSGVPLVERFARAQAATLSPQEVRYCRSVTRLWCGFFALNASVILALAGVGDREAWALYTGLGSYLLMGLLFAGEWVVRRRRFPGAGAPPWRAPSGSAAPASVFRSSPRI